MNIEQARQSAKDETTSPKILAELATHQDYETRKSVAANPNTPTEILLSLCGKFPDRVMNNPVVPLLLLENPHIFTCKNWLYDFNKFIYQTDLELKRLGWTKKQAREHLLKNYNKRTRLHLTDSQCVDYLSKLEQLET